MLRSCILATMPRGLLEYKLYLTKDLRYFHLTKDPRYFHLTKDPRYFHLTKDLWYFHLTIDLRYFLFDFKITFLVHFEIFDVVDFLMAKIKIIKINKYKWNKNSVMVGKENILKNQININILAKEKQWHNNKIYFYLK